MTPTIGSKLSGSTSKFVGVCWCKRSKKWLAGFRSDGKFIHVGYYRTELEAAVGYDGYVRPYGRPLNFPTAEDSALKPAPRPVVERAKKASSSSFRGVSWNKMRKKWYSQFNSEGKVTYIGLYATELDAAKAYDAHARVCGKPLNFPDPDDAPPAVAAADAPAEGAAAPGGPLTMLSGPAPAAPPTAQTNARPATLADLLAPPLIPALGGPARAPSKYHGVSWSAVDEKWLATVTAPGRPAVSIGLYATEVEAARAYDARVKELLASGRQKTRPTASEAQQPGAEAHGAPAPRKRARPEAAAPSTDGAAASTDVRTLQDVIDSTVDERTLQDAHDSSDHRQKRPAPDVSSLEGIAPSPHAEAARPAALPGVPSALPVYDVAANMPPPV